MVSPLTSSHRSPAVALALVVANETLVGSFCACSSFHRILDLCKAMGVLGKPSDKPWKGSLAWCTLSYLLLIVVQFPVMALILFAIESTMSPAGEVMNAMPAAYGFWLVGNQSMLSQNVMNRTDLNTSSPTYQMWTPPAGEQPDTFVHPFLFLLRLRRDEMPALGDCSW